MSTTGHYTRYINQYPGWSDNCDTMYQGVSLGYKDCKKCDHTTCKAKEDIAFRNEWCTDRIGHYQVEHYRGNKNAFCNFILSFDYGDPRKEMPRAYTYFTVYDYQGNLAIQNVLEYMAKFPLERLIDMIIKDRFYNRSYCDYAPYFPGPEEN